MSTRKVSVDQMDTAIMEIMEEYKDLAADDLKKVVKKTANNIKKDISSNAPHRTGAYQKSWAVKKVSETSEKIDLVVHSKNRYQIAHLLEHGHAKRGGGRVAAQVHIAPAEQRGIQQMESDLKKALGGH